MSLAKQFRKFQQCLVLVGLGTKLQTQFKYKYVKAKKHLHVKCSPETSFQRHRTQLLVRNNYRICERTTNIWRETI